MKITYVCKHEAILKDYLLEIGLSKKFCRKVKLYGIMRINGEVVKNYYPVKTNDIIEIEYCEETNEEIVVKQSNLDVMYEDEHILVVNKPYNLSSQPSHKHYEDNLISIVKKYFLDKNINSNVHIVTRLDYATSGLVCIAKDGLTHYQLTNDNTIIKKKYHAIIQGIMTEKKGIIDLPISRLDSSTIKRQVNEGGKRAVTKYAILKEKNNLSLVDIELCTGRTHQIRVHFSFLGFPLLGDLLYGVASDRLYLHCYEIEFINPWTNEQIKIKKESNDFEKIFE